MKLLPEGTRMEPRGEHLDEQLMHESHTEPHASAGETSRRRIVPLNVVAATSFDTISFSLF